jgi:hypothetical protein
VVKPLDKGEKQIGFSIGGPVIGFGGLTIPTPMSSLSMAYGLKESTSVFGGLHTTSLAFGTFQIDAGITKGILIQKNAMPGLSASFVTNFMLDKWEKNFSFYPELDANIYWNYGKNKHLLYLGTTNWFELRGAKAHDEVQNNAWLSTINLGNTWHRKKMNFTLEYKLMAPLQVNDQTVVDYRVFMNKGVNGAFFTVSRRF